MTTAEREVTEKVISDILKSIRTHANEHSRELSQRLFTDVYRGLESEEAAMMVDLAWEKIADLRKEQVFRSVGWEIEQEGRTA